MSEVLNDTDEGVDYTYDEGQGSAGFSRLYSLPPGDSRHLELLTLQFNIYFYGKGETSDLLACRRGVAAGHRIRLFRNESGELAVEARAVGLTSDACPEVAALL